MNSSMQILELTSERCVIASLGSPIGIYFAVGYAFILAALGIWMWLSPTMRARSNPKVLIIFFVAFCVYIPLSVSGSSARVVLSRATGNMTLQGKTMMIPRSVRTVPLSQVEGASVGGRNSQLFINKTDGEQLAIGPDASLGGRQLAADAVNAWLEDYRK